MNMGKLLLIILLLVPLNVWATCRLGEDGNYYTNEDPFVDAANHDFRLKPGSCAIDNGMTLLEVKTDFDGVPRPQGKAYDIGAYEMRVPAETPQPPKGFRIIP